ncbi:MAG: hypothetical protein Ta2D_07130 [Rickettsiales bacterium]|nr:MAG: hypothetical protein Ta2D_07130 [Rickettsiales bacterium]
MDKKFFVRWGIRLLIYAVFVVTPLFVDFNVTIFGFNLTLKTISYNLIIGIFPLIFGVFACGWLCPAGLIQDIVFFRKFGVRIPDKYHKYLRILRYVFAILFITGIYRVNANIQHSIGGIATLKYDFSSYIFWISVGIITISIFIERFFCKYLCPFGSIGGIKSLIRPFTINRDSKCVGCKMCDKICPMQITISKLESSYSPNCINCFKCIETCPKKALHYGIRNYKSTFKDVVQFFKKKK